jgi:signal transduction histidine kinase
VGGVVEQVCGRFIPEAKEKGIALERDVHEEMDLQARVHEADLADCVGNLVENAIKYTPGPGTVWVKVGRGQVADSDGAGSGRGAGGTAPFVYVTVKDKGMGIEPEALRGSEGSGGPGSIFDAFRRGNSALSAGIPGTGLGLSIVREVVEQAGGRVHAVSRPGEGTTFTVTFPAGRSAPARAALRDTRSSRLVIESGKSDIGAEAAGAEEAKDA